MSRWQTGAVFALTCTLGGCNLLVGLDDVRIVESDGGPAAQSGSGGAGAGSSGSGSAGPNGGVGATPPHGSVSTSSGNGGTAPSAGAGGAPTSTGVGAGNVSTSSATSTGAMSSGAGAGGTGAGGAPSTSSASSTTSSSTTGAGGGGPEPACGDGVYDEGEQCDDGNTVSGDGCSEVCKAEPFYQCEAVPPGTCIKQEVLCGDGADNDGDALTDFADPDCDLPAYTPLPCAVIHVYRSVNVPQTIPDSGQMVRKPIIVAEDFTVSHTAVLLDITHPNAGHLDVFLLPPFGDSRTLTTDNGNGGADFTQTVFDSTCFGELVLGAPPFQGCFGPESGLLVGGQPAKGVWRLDVKDDTAGGTGTLQGWALILCAD